MAIIQAMDPLLDIDKTYRYLQQSILDRFRYRSFLGLVWALWQAHRACRHANCHVDVKIRLPMR